MTGCAIAGQLGMRGHAAHRLFLPGLGIEWTGAEHLPAARHVDQERDGDRGQDGSKRRRRSTTSEELFEELHERSSLH